MRGRPRLESWGRRDARARRGDLRRLGAHPRGARAGRRPRRARCSRCRRASTSSEFVPEPRDEALAGLLEEARADPPNPGNANERLPDEGNAERLAAFLADGRPGRRLLREADREQGRAPPARRDPRPRRARRDRRLRRPPPRAGAAGAHAARRADALHRARSSTATSSTCCRSPTSRSCRRSSPRRSGWSPPRPRPTGCPPLVARHSGLAEVAAGLEAEYPAAAAPPGGVRVGRRRRPAGEARGAARAPGGRPRRRCATRRGARSSRAGRGRRSPRGCSHPFPSTASRSQTGHGRSRPCRFRTHAGSAEIAAETPPGRGRTHRPRRRRYPRARPATDGLCANFVTIRPQPSARGRGRSGPLRCLPRGPSDGAPLRSALDERSRGAHGGNLRPAWARNRSSLPTSSSRSRATRSRTGSTSRSRSRRSSRILDPRRSS